MLSSSFLSSRVPKYDFLNRLYCEIGHYSPLKFICDIELKDLNPMILKKLYRQRHVFCCLSYRQSQG